MIVTFNSNRTGKILLKVYDITGRIIYTKPEEAIRGNNTYRLNLPNFISGMYYLEVVNGFEQTRIKFVIQK